jgi:hypothetical protein
MLGRGFGACGSVATTAPREANHDTHVHIDVAKAFATALWTEESHWD